MKRESEQTAPPDSRNLEGWRKAVACGRVAQCSPEVLVAALQDLGPALDASIRDPIAKHLNLMLMRRLRRYIGRNHPNGGEDIILRTQSKIFEVLLDRNSADGKALREAFWVRVSFRAKDAIAKEVDGFLHRWHFSRGRRRMNVLRGVLTKLEVVFR
jgi:hypothetical protein